MEEKYNLGRITFYNEYRDSFVRMKETEVRQSEQRIRFFIAFVTGVLAFIGILDKTSLSNIDAFWLALVSLAILIIYGLLTFSQIIWSSHVIYNLEVTIGILDDLIKEYEPVFKIKIDESDLRADAKIKGITNLKGTFAQYMYLTEGLLVGGFVFLMGTKIFKCQYFFITSIAILFFLITITLMIKWRNVIKNGKQINEQIPSIAGQATGSPSKRGKM